jgi:hypothetical protein
MDNKAIKELDDFLAEWEDTDEKNKAAFLRLKTFLEQKDGVKFDFIPRPGVTYSLRVAHTNQKEKSLFAMVDVIEDSPRWLSVCFYGAMISDPEENGDFVPEGLLGEDAICFDIDEYNEDMLGYVEARLTEACQSAEKG